jgi:hypothetical protein
LYHGPDFSSPDAILTPKVAEIDDERAHSQGRWVEGVDITKKLSHLLTHVAGVRHLENEVVDSVEQLSRFRSNDFAGVA